MISPSTGPADHRAKHLQLSCVPIRDLGRVRRHRVQQYDVYPQSGSTSCPDLLLGLSIDAGNMQVPTKTTIPTRRFSSAIAMVHRLQDHRPEHHASAIADSDPRLGRVAIPWRSCGDDLYGRIRRS